MLELIATWGGVAGCVLALVAILIICIVKAEIKHALDRDKVLFDQNFALKKEVIDTALQIADEIDTYGESIISNTAFQTKAKKCYNDLICVSSTMQLAEEFYSLAVENLEPVNQIRIAKFKVACRKDIGLSMKGSKLVVRAIAKTKIGIASHETIAPVIPSYSEPAQPVMPTQPMQRPVQPAQRPVQPTQPTRPITRPTSPVAPAQRPAPQQPSRPTPPQNQQ